MEFSYDKLEVLDIEITTACNAACPECPRNIPSFNFNEKIDQSEIDLETFKKFFDNDLLRHIKKIQFCGDFGDPAASKDQLDIIKHCKSVNSALTIGLNTNGGLRNVDWWESLGNLLTAETDYVVFSIDGLEDTNHIYRKNVRWKKLIENINAYISTGGNAHWDMLVFDHNRHQINECESLARELGFKFFRTKESNRHLSPLYSQGIMPIIEVKDPDIKCFALQDRSIYITATGLCLPCCILGDTIFQNRESVCSSHPNLLLKKDLSLHHNNIRSLFGHLNDVVATWRTNKPVDQCALCCNNKNLVKDMWKNEVVL